MTIDKLLSWKSPKGDYDLEIWSDGHFRLTIFDVQDNYDVLYNGKEVETLLHILISEMN